MEREEENINLTDTALRKGNRVLKSSPVKNRFVPGKAYINFWIDLIAFLSFIICTVSGAALMRIQHSAHHSIYNTGAGLLNSELFWGLPGYEWAHLHNLSGWVLVALIIVHIALHWRRTFRAGYAVVFLNFLIFLSEISIFFENETISHKQFLSFIFFIFSRAL
jgi:hypothetical protein